MPNLRRSLQGVYRPLNFPLPSNSLPAQALIPAAVSAIKAAANLSVNGKGGRSGMAGAYGPPAKRWPGAYPGRSGMGAVSDVTGWIDNNKALAAGLAIGAWLLFGIVEKRGRR